MTLEELKRFAEAATAYDPYDDAQIEHIIKTFHDATPKLLEMIAVLDAGLTQGLIHAPSNWQTHHDLLAANRRANEIERSL